MVNAIITLIIVISNILCVYSIKSAVSTTLKNTVATGVSFTASEKCFHQIKKNTYLDVTFTSIYPTTHSRKYHEHVLCSLHFMQKNTKVYFFANTPCWAVYFFP